MGCQSITSLPLPWQHSVRFSQNNLLVPQLFTLGGGETLRVAHKPLCHDEPPTLLTDPSALVWLRQGLPPNKVVPRLREKVTSFKQGMPVITSLRNPALRPRHWEAIQNIIGTRLVRDKYFTLGHLLQLKVLEPFLSNCREKISWALPLYHFL